MGKISLDGYRKQWPRVGGVLAMALGGAITLAARRMSKPQLLSAANPRRAAGPPVRGV
jgi:hypothetical protein